MSIPIFTAELVSSSPLQRRSIAEPYAYQSIWGLSPAHSVASAASFKIVTNLRWRNNDGQLAKAIDLILGWSAVKWMRCSPKRLAGGWPVTRLGEPEPEPNFFRATVYRTSLINDSTQAQRPPGGLD